MKPIHYLAALLAFVWWRNFNGGSATVTRTEASIPKDGSNPAYDVWGQLSDSSVISPTHKNIIPTSPTADPGGNAAANLGLMPGWDGSL